jgi:hypothetical protein
MRNVDHLAVQTDRCSARRGLERSDHPMSVFDFLE